MTLHGAPLPVECIYCGTAPLPRLRHRNIDLVVPGAFSAWFRHTPRNGKPLFSMDLALLEVGYKGALHSLLTSSWPLWQQLGIMIGETLKTQNYQCHPALLPCVREDQSRHHVWWRIQLPGYRSLGGSKSCFGMTS